jgi:uncharacterized protein
MSTRNSFFIFIFFITYLPFAHTASFECSQASPGTEQMICADPEASKLDEDMSLRYKAIRAKSAKPELVHQRQGYWLKTRNSCENIGCVRIRYRKRIAELTEREKELKELRLKLEIPDYSKDKNPAFCKRLLTDLRSWTSVTILPPIVTADRISDPRLHRYLGGCDSRKFIRSVQIDPRVWDQNNLDSVSEEELEDFGSVSIATKAFRLYRTNIDNDPSGKEELILYGAGRRAEWADDSDLGINLTYFNVIDTGRCSILNSAQAQDIINEENLSFVGLMRYQNNTYVFDAEYYFMESLWGVGIQKWTYSPRSKRTFFSHVCNYVARD